MLFQKSTLSIFVAAACFLCHEAHAKSSSLRGANSDTSNEGKRALSENERSYFLVDERKNFGQAREHCKSLGMDLASITSAEENRMVAQLCESANSGSLCWIGLALQWLDGTEYIYRNNELYLQNAVVISGKKRSWVDYGGWRYSKGNKERAFICSDVILEEITTSSTTTSTTTTTTTTSTETTTEHPTTTSTKMSPTSTTTKDSVEATEFMCPSGWTPYGSNQKCLKVVNQGKSFAGHESNCQGIAPEGWLGSLVSFHSQDDLDAAGVVCRTILNYSDGCSGGYACRTGLHYDGTIASFTDGSAVDYLPSEVNMWDVGKERCAQLADGNDVSMNCNNLRTFADGGGSCDSAYHKNKGLCQIWPDETGLDEIVPSTSTATTAATPTTTTEPTALVTTTSATTTTTKPTMTTTTTTTEPWTHIPNTYCRYYAQGGDGSCSTGANFDDIWKRCMADGEDKCMGVMWNSCTGRTSDTTVPGAWKLMRAGQEVGDAEHPTTTCGGKNQALGHWDVFARSDLLATPTTTTTEPTTITLAATTSTATTITMPTTTTTTTTTEPWTHIPNTYCRYYAQGGDGSCTTGANFDDIWKRCMADGADKCMGVMWNSCTGRTSDTTVPGAWKLMRAGQEVGDAEHPTATCGGKNQARGHWDVFVRSDQV